MARGRTKPSEVHMPKRVVEDARVRRGFPEDEDVVGLRVQLRVAGTDL